MKKYLLIIVILVMVGCSHSYYGIDKNEENIYNSYNLKEHFTKALTLDQLREIVRGEKQSPVEFKEGEMVEVYTNSQWSKVEYAFFAINKHWFYNVNIKQKDTVHIADDIRKIDPDKELKELADEVITEFYKENKFKLSEPLRKDVIQIAIEAMKKVQSKK